MLIIWNYAPWTASILYSIFDQFGIFQKLNQVEPKSAAIFILITEGGLMTVRNFFTISGFTLFFIKQQKQKTLFVFSQGP